jgi:hypothetical protein
MQGVEGWEGTGFVKYLFDIASSNYTSDCSRTGNGRLKKSAKNSSNVQGVRPVRLKVMGRLQVGREALVLRMVEPMSSRRRKRVEQVLPSRRRISSNNHNRL